MSAPFHYTAYGLGIRSELALPELLAEDGPGEVSVRLGKVEPAPTEGTREAGCFRPTALEARLFWKEVGRFLVRDGREIVVEPAPQVEERVLRLFILGPSLAMLLHQRGMLVLHASAVELGGKAVVFLGGPGWGKSTTAAALHARGHGFVADDVVALEADGSSSPILASGFPQMKLWPEVAASLGESPESMPLLHPLMEKRAHRSLTRFQQEPLGLGLIYVLEEGPSIEVAPVRPQEAVVELVRHSYCVKLLQAEETSSHFIQCANLVNNVPVRRLIRPRSLPALADVARFVEDDADGGS